MAVAAPSPPTVWTVTIPFTHLKDRDKDLSGKIEEGFGPQGLGIISVSDVPDFALLRKNLLYLAPRLANLSEDAKRELEDPDSRNLAANKITGNFPMSLPSLKNLKHLDLSFNSFSGDLSFNSFCSVEIIISCFVEES